MYRNIAAEIKWLYFGTRTTEARILMVVHHGYDHVTIVAMTIINSKCYHALSGVMVDLQQSCYRNSKLKIIM